MFNKCIRKITCMPVTVLSVWFLLFMVPGVRGENGYLPVNIQAESILCYPYKDIYTAAFTGFSKTPITAASAFVPAFSPLLPLNKSTPAIDAFLWKKPPGSITGSLNYFIIHPENGNSVSPEENRLFKNLMKLMLFNGKNPFSSNNILLFKKARFFRSYYSIHIHIYTNFDEIETIKSLKNIESIVPGINLTLRTETK